MALQDSIAHVALVAALAVGCSRSMTSTKPPDEIARAARPAAPEPAPALAAAPAGYTARRLAGFTVFVHETVLAHPPEAEAVVARVEASLAEISALFGSRRTAVAGVKVWVEWEPRDPQRRRGVAEFHRSREWLVANGYDPAKERGIEINDTRGYLAATAGTQPFALLHEFAHAYEMLALGESDPGALAAYEAARTSGQYDAVERVGSTRERAYALTDAREYFAETTEAFLAINDYFPFVREQLRGHDPVGYALMERVWGPQPARTTLTIRACEAVPASTSGGVSTAVVVQNATSQPIELWWVDQGGGRRRYTRVAPGAEDVRQTYEGHAWVALGSDGRCLGGFVAASRAARVVITDATTASATGATGANAESVNAALVFMGRLLLGVRRRQR
jgi:hypothetical protein